MRLQSGPHRSSLGNVRFVRGIGLAALAMLLLPPAAAHANVYCVDFTPPPADCDFSNYDENDLQIALSDAGGDLGADTVRIAPGTYTGPFSYLPVDPISIVGSGQNQTTLDAPSPAMGQTILALGGSAANTVSDLRISIPAPPATEPYTGLSLQGTMASDVTVAGPAANNATGVRMIGGTFQSGTVDLNLAAADSNRGFFNSGSPQIADSTVMADSAVEHSDTGGTTTIHRSTLLPELVGVRLTNGTVQISNSIIDLRANPAIALDATNLNAGPDQKTINANHVTIGGGSAGSIGFRVWATAAAVAQTSTGTLTNSVISGPETPISRQATNNGAPGMDSQANVTVAYSNYDPAANFDVNGINGAGAISVSPAGTQTNLSPGFENPGSGNYHLVATSPLLDIGDPAPAPGEIDRDGNPRALDGLFDCFSVARRDVGAHEFVGSLGMPATCTPAAQPAAIPATKKKCKKRKKRGRGAVMAKKCKRKNRGAR